MFNKKQKKSMNISMITLSLISFLCFSSIIYEIFYPEINNSKIVELEKLINKNSYEEKTGYRIKVEVLNGCGQKKIALMYKRFLREEGYDVIDANNAKSFNNLHTKVIYHTSQIEMAKHISNLLGVNDSLLINDNNVNLMHDITLIIGKDFNDLKSYKEVSLYYPI